MVNYNSFPSRYATEKVSCSKYSGEQNKIMIIVTGSVILLMTIGIYAMSAMSNIRILIVGGAGCVSAASSSTFTFYFTFTFKHVDWLIVVGARCV